MSLDQFGASKGLSSKKKSSQKKEKKKQTEEGENQDFSDENNLSIIINTSETGKRKHHLKCSIGKCGYSRILSKKSLTDEDFICPKCGEKMKLIKSE